MDNNEIIISFRDPPIEMTTKEVVKHIETESLKAVEYGTDVAFALLSFSALATLVALFLKKL